MTMKIKAEKIMVKGEKMVKVVEFKALDRHHLPQKYLDAPPYCYADDYYKGTVFFREENNITWLNFDKLFTPKEFGNLVALLKKCGERLHKINKEIKKTAAKWNGSIEIEI